MAVATGRCPECGFDPPTVSPSDAAVAARSYPRRWRSLLVRPDEGDPALVHRAPGPGEPSALDHGAVAAAGMAASSGALAQVRVHDGADVHLDPAPGAGQRTAGAAAGLTLDDVVGQVTRAAGALAAAIESVHGDEWARTGLLPDGAAMHALDVARVGVHAGSHHLRAADRVLARVKLIPR